MYIISADDKVPFGYPYRPIDTYILDPKIYNSNKNHVSANNNRTKISNKKYMRKYRCVIPHCLAFDIEAVFLHDFPRYRNLLSLTFQEKVSSQTNLLRTKSLQKIQMKQATIKKHRISYFYLRFSSSISLPSDKHTLITNFNITRTLQLQRCTVIFINNLT